MGYGIQVRKEKIKKLLGNWRKGELEEGAYRKRKKRYKEMCEKKRKKEKGRKSKQGK